MSYRDIQSNSRVLVPIARPQPVKTKRISGRFQSRAVHKKVLTGCRTCKARHIKCDELKPACDKCTLTGRTCEGYATEPLRISGPASTQATTCFVTYIPSLDIPGGTRARRAFHYFRCRSGDAMSRYFASDFWDCLVLQISCNQATVRHALIALSSLYEEYEFSACLKKGLTAGTRESDLTFALKEYNKAVQLLSADLASDKPPIEAILASCLIFICIEFLQDDVDSAIQHLVAGLNILNIDEANLLTSPAKSPALIKFTNKAVHSTISKHFKKLLTQVISHGFPHSGSPSESIPFASFSISVPSIFATLDEAHSTLEEIHGTFFQLVRRLRNNQQLTAFVHELDSGIRSRNYIINDFFNRLDHWENAVDDLVSQLKALRALDRSQETGLTLMRLHHRLMHTILKNTPATTEMQYDRFRHIFEEMLSYCSALINGMNSDNTELPTLGVDIGVLGPLHFVVFKCRDIPIRARALDLMRRAPPREGIWRRDSVLKLALWTIRKEESEAIRLGWQPGEIIPEAARIYWEGLEEVERDDGVKMTVIRWWMRRGVEMQFKEEVEDMGIDMRGWYEEDVSWDYRRSSHREAASQILS